MCARGRGGQFIARWSGAEVSGRVVVYNNPFARDQIDHSARRKS